MTIIISSIIASIRISFVVLQNCLYLNPRGFPFVYFSSPSHWGRRQGVSEWLPGAGCCLKLQHIAVPEWATGSSVKLFQYDKQQDSQKENLFPFEIRT